MIFFQDDSIRLLTVNPLWNKLISRTNSQRDTSLNIVFQREHFNFKQQTQSVNYRSWSIHKLWTECIRKENMNAEKKHWKESWHLHEKM